MTLSLADHHTKMHHAECNIEATRFSEKQTLHIHGTCGHDRNGHDPAHQTAQDKTTTTWHTHQNKTMPNASITSKENLVQSDVESLLQACRLTPTQ